MSICNTNIHFLEEEYLFLYSDFIGQFWNSMSSLSFCIVPIFINSTEYVIKRSNILIVIVGLGSFWFHATCSFTGELVDEVSMLLFSLSILDGLKHTNPLIENSIVPNINRASLMVTGFYIWQGWHTVFCLVFGITLFIPSVIMVSSKKNKTHLMKAACFMSCAFCCWFLERLGIWHFLHSFWHILSAFASYHWIKQLEVHRAFSWQLQ